MSRYSLLGKVPLDNLTFPSDLKQHSQDNFGDLVTLGHLLQQFLNCFRQLQDLISCWRDAFLFGFVEEVPKQESTNRILVIVLFVDCALDDQLGQLAGNLQISEIG